MKTNDLQHPIATPHSGGQWHSPAPKPVAVACTCDAGFGLTWQHLAESAYAQVRRLAAKLNKVELEREADAAKPILCSVCECELQRDGSGLKPCETCIKHFGRRLREGEK